MLVSYNNGALNIFDVEGNRLPFQYLNGVHITSLHCGNRCNPIISSGCYFLAKLPSHNRLELCGVCTPFDSQVYTFSMHTTLEIHMTLREWERKYPKFWLHLFYET